MSISDEETRTKNIEILSPLYINWGVRDCGFGQLSIYQSDDGKLHCSNEAMGRAWVKGLLSELVDACIFDCPHSLETKEPIKPFYQAINETKT